MSETGTTPASTGQRGARLAVIIIAAAVIVIGVVVAAAFAIASIIRKPADPNGEVVATPVATETSTPAAGPTPQETDVVQAAPSAADASGGFLVNADGTLGGTPPEGAVRIDVYLDFLCPICNEFENIDGETLASLRADGTIALYYHPVSILDRYSQGTRYSTRASAALATIAEYDPAHFEAFFSALFDNQPPENSTGLTNAQMIAIATDVGVPLDVAAKINRGEFEQWVTDATDVALADGLKGTPWVRAEQKAEISGGIWFYPDNFAYAIAFIHENGVQAFIDAVAEANAAA